MDAELSRPDWLATVQSGRKQVQSRVCTPSFMYVFAPQTGRTWAEKHVFRDTLKMMIGMVQLETLLRIAGDFNAHIGETEPGEEEM